MDGEVKKAGSKRLSKTTESSIDSDDDEPIGSIFKLKKIKNPRKVKLESEGHVLKGKKLEVKKEKLGVNDEDFGAMDDTLASFRKKLKAPKRDAGSGTPRVRNSILNGSLKVDEALDMESMSKTLEESHDLGAGGSDATMKKRVKNRLKGKGKEKRPKIGSTSTLITHHAESEDNSGNLGCQAHTLEAKERGMPYQEDLSQPLVVKLDDSLSSAFEKLDDSLSAFIQKAQPGLSRKSRAIASFSQNSKARTSEDEYASNSESVSGDIKGGALRRHRPASASKRFRKNPKSGSTTIGSRSSQCNMMASQNIDDTPCHVSNSVEETHNHDIFSVSTDTDDNMKLNDNGCVRSSQSVKGETATELSNEGKEPIDIVIEDELNKELDNAFDREAKDISSELLSSLAPEIPSLVKEELSVPCSDDKMLSKCCDRSSQEIHDLVIDKVFDVLSHSLSEKSCPGKFEEEAVKPENSLVYDQGIDALPQTDEHLPSFVSHFGENGETLIDLDKSYTCLEEPDLASVASQEENALKQDSEPYPTVEASPGNHKSGTDLEVIHLEKSFANEVDVSVQKYTSTSNQSQQSVDSPRGTTVPGNGDLISIEEVNEASLASPTPDENQCSRDDILSLPDSGKKDAKLTAFQRSMRNAKKRKHGDMAYEGDADWDILISEQSSPQTQIDRSIKMREKFDSSADMNNETESVGAAAVSAGLRARSASPIEKIKFKEVLKRKGGLQEYLECRNHILGLWGKDITRILPLTDCGVQDSPSDEESPRDALIREIYVFLDQRGFINVGAVSKKENKEPSFMCDHDHYKNRKFKASSVASVTDSEDGVTFILGQVKGSEISVEQNNGLICDDRDQVSKASERCPVSSAAVELPISTSHKVCHEDICKQMGSDNVKSPNRLMNLDPLCVDQSADLLDEKPILAIAPNAKNDLPSVQSSLYNCVAGSDHLQCDSEAQKKIIVIGAGPAGLTAARHLQRQGFSVTVLEARDRVGGRIFTDRSSLSVPVDLGASIITGIEADVASERRPDPSTLVCNQLGLELTVLHGFCPLYDSVTGEKVPPDLDDSLQAEFNSIIDDLDLLVEQIGKERANKMSLEDGLEYGLRRHRRPQFRIDIGKFGLQESMDAFRGCKRSSFDGEVSHKQSSKDEILSPLERRVMNWHIAHTEYGCAAFLKDVSLPNWNQDENYGGFGGAHAMVKGGYSTVAESLGKGLRIHLSHVVTDVSYGSDDLAAVNGQHRVKICTSNGSQFLGDAVLITVPLGCLKANTINFSPPLPDWKCSSINRLGFGVLNKVVLEFSEVFWDDSLDYFGATAEETDQRGRCFMFWNIKKTVGAPVLIALLVGKAAIDTQEKGLSDHVNHAMMVLRKLFGDASVPDPVASVVTDWGSDPYSYGAYSYVAIGASGEDYDILGRPVQNCLFFAGEATCKEHPDTVGGAMITGLREAVRIVDIFSSGNDYTAEVEAMEAVQRKTVSERDEVRAIIKKLEAIELSNVMIRQTLLRNMFFTAKTTVGRLHLAKELLDLPVEALRSFAGSKEGLTTLNSWILDSMGKNGTQLLRQCVHILVDVSTDLLAVRLSGIGKTVKEKVCVHTSRDIRAIASQLVSLWLDIFRKEKASSGGVKALRQTSNVDSSKRKHQKDPASGKPPLSSDHGTLESKGRLQTSSSGASHLLCNASMKEEDGKPVKLETMSHSSLSRVDIKKEEKTRAMSEEEQAAFAAAEVARAAAEAAAKAYASSEANTSLQLPKIPSFHKFARREQYAQMDESELRKKWSGGVLGRQDCISEIDSRNCRVRDWSVDFSAACLNIDSSKMSVDNLSQRSHSNEIACHLKFREHSGESAAVDSNTFTGAWVDTVGNEGIKDYNAIDRWQSQAAAADPDFYNPTMHIKDEEDSTTSSRPPIWNHDRRVNESSISQVTINKEPLDNHHHRGAERIKHSVVDYVGSLLMPLYKARKIDKEGYKSIMKKTATKVMEQATDAEKAMAVFEFLDFKRKNKIRSFVDKLIERHMAVNRPKP